MYAIETDSEYVPAIAFRIPWNSLIGRTILLYVSSSSGTTDEFISSKDDA